MRKYEVVFNDKKKPESKLLSGEEGSGGIIEPLREKLFRMGHCKGVDHMIVALKDNFIIIRIFLLQTIFWIFENFLIFIGYETLKLQSERKNDVVSVLENE